MDAAQALSDAELIASVRNGDLEAYGELFSRHHHAAERMARQLVGQADADDLAGDAFAKVLDALRGGGGPDVSFRAYLLTTVRRVHVDRMRSGKRFTATDDIAAYEREPESFDDPSVTGFESGAAARAFAALPERWQAVLWHTEVEGEKPAAVAPLLGLTANGVSALAYRAREGLRQAYLQQHLADVANDRCRWSTERLGAYVRGGLTKRENKILREHLDECVKCTAVYLELVEVNSALPALLAPALLGTAGVGYLAAGGGAKIGGAGLLFSVWRRITANGVRTAAAAGSGAAVVAVAVVAAVALNGDDKPEGVTSQDAISSTRPAASQPPGNNPTSSATTGPTSAPTSAPTTGPTTAPATAPTSARTTAPTFAPTSPPTSAPSSEPTSGPTSAPTDEPTSGPTSAPTRGPTSAPTSVETSTPPPTSSTSSTPPPPPTSTTTSPPPPPPPAPKLDEALLTIDTPTPGNRGRSALTAIQPSADVRGAAVEPVGSERRRLTVAPVPGTSRVTVEIAYGARLSWPVAGDPPGWTCTPNRARRTGLCTAKSPTAPTPLTIEFDTPNGGAADDRTFTATARTFSGDSRTARYFDDDSDKLRPAGRNDDLLTVADDTLSIDPPEDNEFPVVVTLGYGDALSWPITGDPDGWTCDRDKRTCTAEDRKRPARLPLRFTPPETGSESDRTFTVTAKVGGLYDDFTRTLPAVFDSEKLLRVKKSWYGLWAYRVTFVVTPPEGHTGKVALDIEYGEDMVWGFRDLRDWKCKWNPVRNTVRCVSKVSRPDPLDAVLYVIDWRPGGDASLVATASTGDVTDTDADSDIRTKHSRSTPLAIVSGERGQPARRRRTQRRTGS